MESKELCKKIANKESVVLQPTKKEFNDLKYFSALKDFTANVNGKITIKWDGNLIKIKFTKDEFEWYSPEFTSCTFEDLYLMLMEEWLDYNES